jgi:hypothetical protein
MSPTCHRVTCRLPQGRNLLHIEAVTGSRVMVADNGEVEIYAPTRRQYEHAVECIAVVEGLTIQEGEVYKVKVKRALPLPYVQCGCRLLFGGITIGV